MSATLIELHTIDELSSALDESAVRPVLFFKHSTTCPISSRALRELHAHLDSADSTVSYRMIIVQSDRDLSDELAARLGINHESPQAILVRSGRVVWNVSHIEITAAGLEDALRTVAGS